MNNGAILQWPWFKKLSIACLAAVSLASLPIGPSARAEGGEALSLYVSPSGDDGNDGSLDHPFHTLQKARDAVRGLNDDMNGDITVYLRGGTYDVTDTLAFDETDSGTNGHDVIYRNYPGETPVISGGERIEGWAEENGVYEADATGMKFRDLWVNGKRAVRARSPSFKIRSWDDSAQLINVDAAAVDAWGGKLDPQLEIVINQHWVRSYSRLDDFSVQDGAASLVMMEEARKKLFGDTYPDRAANQSIHFENSLLYLDEPGEWLLDEANAKVYYIPLPGETPESLDARTGALETFLDFKGSAPDKRVHNITVSGLAFEYTKYQYPIDKNYVKPGQAGLADGVYDGSRRQPAAIQLEAADRITLERNVIRHTGATAIDIRGSSSDNRVIGNAITDIGGSGIFEGLFSEPGANTTDPTRMTKGNDIENNYLNGISLTSCGVGIISGFSQGVTIAHNEVANTDYSGISMGWGWTANDTSLMNNTVKDNNIYGVMKALADGAAIYTLSKTPNSQIVGNYIHDIDSNEFASNYPVAGIYLDQATSGYNIANNVMTRVGQTFYANVVADDGNTLANNDSQDPAIIANAGLEPAYWDIVPGAELDHGGAEIAVSERGSVRLDGTVASSGTTDSTAVSITKNDAAVWSGHAAAEASESFHLNIDVEPGDVIRFGPQAGVVWHSRVKPERYTPNLVIDNVTFDGMEDGEPKIDYRNRIYTVLANPDVDTGNLDVKVQTPPGTQLERIGGDSHDYSSDAVFRIRLADGADNPDFEGGVKYKDWKLKVLRDSESVSVDGYNLANELSDVDNWTTGGGTKTAVDNGVQFNGGYALYEGKKFTDELATFNMKTSDSGWPSIVFRVQDGGKDPIGPGNASYITVIKSTGIELQRFNDGVRTVFYGNVGGLPSVYGDAIPNTMFDFDKANLVQVGAMNEDDGVRLVLYINGKVVFDCKDTADGRIEAPGYLGSYQADNSITLSRAPQAGGGDGEPPSVRPLLEVELGKAKALLDGADIGDGNGQYPQWAKEYLQSQIDEAQSRDDQAEATEEELNAAISSLKAAEAAFAQSQNVPVNVALGKPTTSSEAGQILVGYGPDKVVDGVVGFGNGWSAESGVWPDGKSIKPWLTIDLEAAYTIGAVEVVARPNGNYDGEKKTFEIQASNDPDFAEGRYTVLGKVDATPFEGDSWRLDVTDPEPYRYIRYAKTNVDYAFVSELNVWSASKPELYSISGTVKDAAGKGVPGAEVDVYSSAAADADAPVGTAVSGEDGSYAVSPALPAGKYALKATGADGLVTEQTVFLPYADATGVDLALLPDLSIEPGLWAIGSPLLTDASGHPLQQLEASGKVRADVRIANLQSEPQEATLIVALYAPDHSLASYVDRKTTVAAGGTVHLQTELPLPDKVDGYTLKVLVWDSLEGMHPLSTAVPLP